MVILCTKSTIVTLFWCLYKWYYVVRFFWFAMSLHEFSSFHHVCLWYLCRDLYHTFIIKGRCLLWFMKYLYVNYFQIPEQLDKTHSLMLFSWYQAQNVDNNTVLKCCHLCFVILTLIIFNEILHWNFNNILI